MQYRVRISSAPSLCVQSKTLSKEDKKELRSRGIKLSDRKAVDDYLAERDAAEKAKAEAERLAAEEAAKADREANPTTEDLLKQILAELKNK